MSDTKAVAWFKWIAFWLVGIAVGSMLSHLFGPLTDVVAWFGLFLIALLVMIERLWRMHWRSEQPDEYWTDPTFREY